MVCSKSGLVFPQASVKFHVLTCRYALGQSGSGVVTSLIRLIRGAGEQLSEAAGTRDNAADIPAASLHSRVLLRLPLEVVSTGAMVSDTEIVCSKSGLVFPQASVKFHVLTCRYALGQSGSGVVTSLIRLIRGAGEQLSEAAGTRDNATDIPAASLHSRVLLRLPLEVVSTGAVVSDTEIVCSKSGLVFPQASVKFHVLTCRYALGQSGSGVVTSLIRLIRGAGEQLSEAAGTRDNAADIPAASLHSRVLLRLPLRVVSTGAMVSDTEMVCSKSGLVFPQASVKFHVLTCRYALGQSGSGVVTSLIRLIRGAGEQLSEAAGTRDNAADIPAASLHSRVLLRLPLEVVSTGAMVSDTEIVCSKSGLVFPQASVKFHVLTCRYALGQSGSGVVTSLIRLIRGAGEQLSEAAGTRDNATDIPAASLHSRVLLRLPLEVVSTGAVVSDTEIVCSKSGLVFPQASVKFHVLTCRYALGQSGSGVVTSLIRLIRGAGEQLSEAAGTRDNAADIPAASLHSRVLLRLPLRVVSTGAMVSETEMVCSKSGLVFPQASVKFHVLTCRYALGQSGSGVVTSLIRLIRGAGEQLSEAAGTRDNAADIPAASLHSRVLLRLPLRVVSTGAMVSDTEMVCSKLGLVFPQASVKFHVLTCRYALGQSGSGVVTSLIRLIRGAGEQLSEAVGTRDNAADIPAASLHSRVLLRLPLRVVSTGAMVSDTEMVCSKLGLVFPQASVKFHVLTCRYALGQSGSGVVTSLIRLIRGAGEQLSEAAGTRDNAADIPAASLHSRVLLRLPLRVVSTGAMVSDTEMVCSKSGLVFPQVSVKFHVLTCRYALGQSGSGVVTSLIRLIRGAGEQLSEAAGTRDNAADIPAASLHSRVLLRLPLRVVSTGAMVSDTEMVCSKLGLVFPQASVKFHVLTCRYALGQPGSGVVTSLIRLIRGAGEQLSEAVGTRDNAADIPAASLHSRVLLRLPLRVVSTGAMVSDTEMVCSKSGLVFPQASVKFHVLTCRYALGQSGSGVVTSLIRLIRGAGEQLSEAAGTRDNATDIPAASLHSRVLLRLPPRVVSTGAMVSDTEMVCSKSGLVFPQASVKFHVLTCRYALGQSGSGVVTSLIRLIRGAGEQLSEAAGTRDNAADIPAASLHSRVLLRLPLEVVSTGAMVSDTEIVCSKSGLVFPQASVKFHVLTCRYALGQSGSGVVTSLIRLIRGAGEQLSEAAGTRDNATDIPAASLHSRVLLRLPLEVVSTGAVVSDTEIVCSKSGLVFPQASVKFHVLTCRYALGQSGSGVVTSLIRLIRGAGEQLSEAAGTRDNAADIPAASLHSRVLLRLPLRVVSTGAMVSETEMVCSKSGLVFPQASVKFHVLTCRYALGQSGSGVVTSLIRLIRGAGEQLSEAAGTRDNAADIPAASLHSRVLLRLPLRVVSTGAMVSDTEMVCSKLGLVFPQASVKFHVLTCRYALGQSGSGVVTSLIRLIRGAGEQLSEAVGTRDNAADIPAASLHSRVLLRLPLRVVSTGAMVSDTEMVCSKLGLVFPQASVKFHVLTCRYALGQSGSGVVTSLIRLIRGAGEQLSEAAGTRDNAADIPAASLHSRVLLRLPLRVVSTGAMVSDTEMVCSKSGLVFPQASVKFHVLTCRYPLGQSGSGVVTSLIRLIRGAGEQLSEAAGTRDNAADIPAASLHSRVLLRLPLRVVSTGAMVSDTEMVCSKLGLVFPQASVKFHVLTCRYALGQPGSGVVTSLIRLIRGAGEQLSEAVGTRDNAADIPAASLHSRVLLRLPLRVVSTGAMVSDTEMVCSKSGLVFPQASVKFHVLTCRYALGQSGSGVVTSLIRLIRGAGEQLSEAAGTRDNAADIPAASLHSRVLLRLPLRVVSTGAMVSETEMVCSKSGLVFPQASVKFHVLTCRYALGQSGSGVVTSLIRLIRGAGEQLSEAAGTRDNAADIPAASLHSRVLLRLPLRVLSTGAMVSDTEMVCSKSGLVFPQASVKFHVLTCRYALGQSGSGVVTSLIRLIRGAGEQLSEAAGTRDNAADIPAASLHSRVLLRLPLRVVSMGAVVSDTEMVCSKSGLVFPQASVKFHVLTCRYALGQSGSGVVTSLIRLIRGAGEQLSEAAGTRDNAADIPAASLHSRVLLRLPLRVVSTGAVVSETEMVCSKSGLVFPQASVKFHVLTCRYALGQSGSGVVTSLIRLIRGAGEQLSEAAGTRDNAADIPAASLHSRVLLRLPLRVVSTGAMVSDTEMVCSKSGLVFPQASVKFHVLTCRYALGQSGSGVVTSLIRLIRGAGEQLSEAAGTRDNAADIPAASLHSRVLLRLPLEVVSTGAMVSETEMVCSKSGLVFPQASVKFHVLTCRYALGQSGSGVVTSLIRLIRGAGEQLSEAAGTRDNAADIPAASLHSRVLLRLPLRVVSTGAMVSDTEMVCSKSGLVFPQASVKFHVLTCRYALGQSGSGVVTSLIRLIRGAGEQLSEAAGTRDNAADIPAASLHSRVLLRLPLEVVSTGAMVSETEMVCSKSGLVFPQASVKFHVLTCRYALGQSGSGVVTSLIRLIRGAGEQLSEAAGTRDNAADIPAASLHSRVLLRLPLEVVSTGAMVSETEMVCSKSGLVFPQASVKFHVLTCR